MYKTNALMYAFKLRKLRLRCENVNLNKKTFKPIIPILTISASTRFKGRVKFDYKLVFTNVLYNSRESYLKFHNKLMKCCSFCF